MPLADVTPPSRRSALDIRIPATLSIG